MLMYPPSAGAKKRSIHGTATMACRSKKEEYA